MIRLTRKILPFFLICIVVICSCKKNNDTAAGRTMTDVENDFKALDLTPGIHDVSLEILNGVVY